MKISQQQVKAFARIVRRKRTEEASAERAKLKKNPKIIIEAKKMMAADRKLKKLKEETYKLQNQFHFNTFSCGTIKRELKHYIDHICNVNAPIRGNNWPGNPIDKAIEDEILVASIDAETLGELEFKLKLKKTTS